MKKGEVKKVVEPAIILEPIEAVKKFTTDNKLDFTGSGSDLNGHCTTLAGFICYKAESMGEGYTIIDSLKLSDEATTELTRVFDYAYVNDYESFWEIPEAKEKYIF